MPARPSPDTGTDEPIDALPTEWIESYWAEHDLGDPTGFLAMSSFLRFHQLLRAAVEPRLKEHGLGLTDYLLLITLATQGGTAVIGQLARELLVRATTATFAIERLERRELVTRAVHPSDRRAVQVSMTDTGHELVLAATRALAGVTFGIPGGDGPALRELLPLLGTLRDAAGDTPR
jgi:DNA-binding MarR family transcriptional regulator